MACLTGYTRTFLGGRQLGSVILRAVAFCVFAFGACYAQTGYVSVTTYGVKCDGVTDDTAKLRNAITAAETTKGVTLLLPPTGQPCLISGSLDIGVGGNGLIFRGQASGFSQIKAMPGTYSTYLDAKSGTNKTYMIGISAGTCVNAQFAEVHDMDIYGGQNVDTTAASNCGEENTGFHNVFLHGANWCGLYVGQHAINSHYDDLTIYTQPGAYGIIHVADSRIRFSDLTLAGGYQSGTNNAGLLVLGGHPTITNVHCENVWNCIDVVAYGRISNVDCSPSSTIKNACIRIESSGTALVDTLTSDGGIVPFIQDCLQSATCPIHSAYWLFLYYSAPSLVVSSDGTIPWSIPSVAKANTGVRYVCVDTKGNLVSQASPCTGT